MRSATATEMALAIRGVGVDEASALAMNVFGVERVVFPVGKMAVPRRRGLRKRFESELDDVRDALRKAELYSCVPGAAGEDDRLFALEAAVEDDDGCRATKRRKASPFAECARERLAGRLASMAAALPDHVVAFLQDRRVGDADSLGDGGEIEMDDAQSMEGGALFQLKMLLDKFAPEGTPKLLLDKFAAAVSTPKSLGGRGAPLAASGVSCLSQAQHQEAGGGMPPVQEEEEEEAINICGGVSRIVIRDIAEEYGELVNDIGVQLLSPLQRKYVDLAVEDGYVDICGDASPVKFQAIAAKTGDCSSPSSSSSTSSDSDATSTDSDSSSSSPAVLSKENSHYRAGEPVPVPEADPIQGVHNAQPPRPAPEAIHIAEPENQCAAATVIAVTKSPPAPTFLPNAQPPRPAPEAIHIAEPENQCAAATVIAVTKRPPAPTFLPNARPPRPAPEAIHIAEPENQCAAATVIAVTKSPHAPTFLPKECGALAQPPEQVPEAVQIAEPEEPKEKCVAPAATVHHVTGSAPPAAVLPNENGTSSQPAPVPAPVVAQIAEPQPPPPPPPQPQEVQTSNLIAMAQEEKKRRHEEKKRRVMAEARQKLLEMEKAALPDQRIHPRDMELLGIAAFEHVVSTVRDARTPQPQVNDEVVLRLSPGRPSILQQLGVFLKADDGCEEQSPPLAVASDGEEMDMEIEEGQIL